MGQNLVCQRYACQNAASLSNRGEQRGLWDHHVLYRSVCSRYKCRCYIFVDVRLSLHSFLLWGEFLVHIISSRQTITNPKPEWSIFWWIPLQSPPFRVTSAEVSIICPDIIHLTHIETTSLSHILLNKAPIICTGRGRHGGWRQLIQTRQGRIPWGWLPSFRIIPART